MSKDANQSGAETGKHPDHFLAEWREYRGYSQRELADMIGASNSKISRIENGETELRPSFAKKIARFFGIPMVAYSQSIHRAKAGRPLRCSTCGPI